MSGLLLRFLCLLCTLLGLLCLRVLTGSHLAQPRADQRISCTQVVVEEAQGAVFGGSNQPERELGEFDGQRIQINAIDACCATRRFQ